MRIIKAVVGLLGAGAVTVPLLVYRPAEKAPDVPAAPVSAEPLAQSVPAPFLRQPPAAGNPSAYQLPGRKFLIRATLNPPTAYSGAVVTGAANGKMDTDAAGNASGVFQVVQPGPATVTPTTASGTGTPITVNCANLPPAITIGLTVGPLRTVTYSGTVTDDTPDSRVGLTVFLDGPLGVRGQWAMVRPDGSWSITTTLGGGVPATPVVARVTDWYAVSGSATLP